MDIDKFVRDIDEVMATNAKSRLKELIDNAAPADLALSAPQVSEEYAGDYFASLSIHPKADEILAEMEGGARREFISVIHARNPNKIKEFFGKIDIDDRVKILSEAPEEELEWLIEQQPLKDKQQVLKLLLYHESSAGRIMTTEFVSARLDTKLHEAFDILKDSPNAEIAYYFYILDKYGKLFGVVSLRDILKHDKSLSMRDVMTKDVIKVRVDMDQEEVASYVERYNLAAVPVVDEFDIMRGLVTVDDVIDIIRKESSEDILKLAGTSDKEFISKSSWQGFLIRVPWLLISFLGGFVTIQTMSYFSSKISNILLLSFVPIIAGMGGNIGSQSSTIIVRGLAVGKILKGKLMKVFIKEVGTGMLLGIFFGILLALVALIQFSDVPEMLLLVGGGIFFSMIASALIGSLTPVILNKCGVDPAIATAPFVTMAIDNICLVGYLGSAVILFG